MRLLSEIEIESVVQPQSPQTRVSVASSSSPSAGTAGAAASLSTPRSARRRLLGIRVSFRRKLQPSRYLLRRRTGAARVGMWRESRSHASSEGQDPGVRHAMSSSYWTDTSVSVSCNDHSDADWPDTLSSSRSQPPPAIDRRSSAWKRLAELRLRRPKPRRQTFSISFLPWKMDANSYYSHPEAAAEWVPDTASARCQICLAAFNQLTRRRHHCRLCGHLICNDCSLQRTYFPRLDAESQSRTNHALVKSGAPQRTCNGCARTLQNMVMQGDIRVLNVTSEKSATVDGKPDRASLASSRVGYGSNQDERGGLFGLAVRRGNERSQSDSTMAPWARYQTRQALQHTMAQARPALMGDGIAPSEELELILDARAKSRAGSAFAQQHVIHSKWLEQWLRYVHQDLNEDETAPYGGMPTIRSSYVQSENFSQRAQVSRPGPISNYALLDFVSGKLVRKDGLQRSRGAGIDGDFHVVSRDVWLVFLRLYGGGPSIQIQGEVSPTSNPMWVVPHADMAMRGYVDAAWSPMPDQWLITELDNNIPSDQWTTSDLAHTRSMSMVKPMPVGYRLDRNSRLATSTFIEDCEDKGSARVALSKSMPPPREKPPRLHVTSGFVSYFKKRRASDEQFSTGTSTISQISEGVVLFDPTQLQKNGRQPGWAHDDDEDTFSSQRSCASADPRETIAAVAAFASAAAEARRKSAISLNRHSSKRAVNSRNFHAISSA